MAKRCRDEVATPARARLLKRRRHPGPDGSEDVDTTERSDDTTRRRRIAGERPGVKPDTSPEPDATVSTTDAPSPDSSDTSADTTDDPAGSGETESQAMARHLNEKRATRKGNVEPANPGRTEDAATDGDDADPRAASSTPTRTSRPIAATLIGLTVGAVLTGLVYAGMQAFQAIYNTPAGDGVGAVTLVVVLLVSMLAGRYLLRWRGLPDPNATTLLAVMLMVIVTLAFLLPIVFAPWMLLITPALGAASYVASHLLIAHLG